MTCSFRGAGTSLEVVKIRTGARQAPMFVYYSDVNNSEGAPLMLLPCPAHSVVAAEPPGTGPGYWSGAPCAVAGDGEIFLAYRLRRPIGQGRGYAVAVARSVDGE